MVILFMGHIGEVAGPLPYGLDECEARIARLEADYDNAVAAGRLPPRQLQFICQFAPERPVISEPST